MATDTFVVNTRVSTLADGIEVDFANFGTDRTKPNYGGSNEHWIAYSSTMIAQTKRDKPDAYVYGHISQTWSDGARDSWDRFGDVFAQ